MTQVTQLLLEVQRKTPGSSEELFGVLYEELRRLASQQFRRESVGHILQPTALAIGDGPRKVIGARILDFGEGPLRPFSHVELSTLWRKQNEWSLKLVGA